MRPQIAMAAAALLAAPAAAAHPPSPAAHLFGGGATFPATFYADAVFAYNALHPGAAASYTPMSSGAGRCRILDYEALCDPTDTRQPKTISWAGSDFTLNDEDYALFPDVQMYPVVAGAVIPVYNLPQDTPGYSPLKLTNALLAQLFQGAVTSWGHPRLVELNPWLANLAHPNATIELVVRSEESGTTMILKQSLSRMDAEFAAQIGATPDANWPGVAVKKVAHYFLAPYILATPYTLSYLVYSEMTKLEVPSVHMVKESKRVVAPSVQAVEFALAEMGIQVGDSSSRLTANLGNAHGEYAWPIVGYTYAVVRKETTRFEAGESCETRAELARFFTWLYSSPIAAKLATRNGFAPLPLTVSNIVVERIHNDIKCNSTLASASGIEMALHMKGTGIMTSIFEFSSLLYGEISPSVSLTYQVAQGESELTNELRGAKLMAVGQGDDGLAAILALQADATSSEGMVRLPLAGVAVEVVYDLCGSFSNNCVAPGKQLVLDLPTLAAIVDGEIMSWVDSRLAALNPWMYDSAIATALATVPMTVFSESHDSDTAQVLRRALLAVKPSLSFGVAGSAAVHAEPSAERVLSAMAAHGFSIGIVARVGTIEGRARVSAAAIARPNSTKGISPSVQSVLACAGPDSADLYESPHPDCYPLSAKIVAVLRRTYDEAECPVETDASGPHYVAKLFQWALKGNDSSPMFHAFEVFNLAPLFTTLIAGEIEEELGSLSCNGVSILYVDFDGHFIPRGLQIAGLFFTLLAFLVGLSFAVWVFRMRGHKVVKAAQPSFLLLMIAGTWITLSTLIPMTFDHNGLEPAEGSVPGEPGMHPSLDFGCNMQLACYAIGFATTFGAILAKVRRVVKIVVNADKVNEAVGIREMMLKALYFVALEALLLIAMVSSDSTRLYYKVKVLRTDDSGNVLESDGYCTAKSPWIFPPLIMLINFVALGYGNYLCFSSRKVNNEYNEGKFLTFALVNTLQTHIISILISAFVYDHAVPFFVLKWLAIMSISMGTLGLMLMPRFIKVHFPDLDKSSKGVWVFVKQSVRVAPRPGRPSLHHNNTVCFSAYPSSIDGR